MSESSGCCWSDRLRGHSKRGPPSLRRPELHTRGVAGAPAPWSAGEDPSYHLQAFCSSVFLGLWLHPLSRCLHCYLVGLCVAVSSHASSCKDTSCAGLRDHPDPARHRLNPIPAAKTPFPSEYTLTFPGTLFGCPVASKLGVCWTDILHRSQGGAPASSHGRLLWAWHS